MYKEVLERKSKGAFKLANPKHQHRTERQSTWFIHESTISMLWFVPYDCP